ncbi:hypothetical protein HOG47_07310 [archaeon]|jgi:RNase P/RNase MRP subunit p30|nr:hypothetical protein [archaeon]
MEDLVLMKENNELNKITSNLGFSKVMYSNNFVLIESENKKEILKLILAGKKAKKLIVIKAKTEELLRFLLEKTKVDIVYGVEDIHPRDSLHYLRGGIDQILCKIAYDKKKTIAFSFSDILNKKNKAKKLARIKANLRLCKKYKVETKIFTFAKSYEDLRSKKDLKAFENCLRKDKI